jgi:hypothetical protein
MTQELGPNQRKWVEALRSGAYERGVGLLCNKGAYCCLGVGCDLFIGKPDRRKDVALWGSHFATAPKELIDALGLRDEIGHGLNGGVLAWMNDDGFSFDEIAAAIEADPANWFTEAK